MLLSTVCQASIDTTKTDLGLHLKLLEICYFPYPLQELVCTADDEEAMRSYRRALENSMSGASAAHPYELIGEEKMSLSKVWYQDPTRL